jgi:hypothetical protein
MRNGGRGRPLNWVVSWLMEQGAFENDVLEMCGNDYEAPHTIAGDLARELGRPVTESEVRAAMLALASRGQLQAYVFEGSSNRYVPISSTTAIDRKDAWFMAPRSK